MPFTDNQLIERLPKAVRKRFLARCEPFELVLSAELSARGTLLTHACFPVTGFISLVIDIDSHPPLEVGMVGREAMLGSELALGVATTPWRAVVQGAGHSWRIEARALRQAMLDMPALQTVLQRSLMVRLHQQALASACERFHPIGQRLARWLLMSQDRAGTDHFHVTQEFISLMLGVACRRSVRNSTDANRPITHARSVDPSIRRSVDPHRRRPQRRLDETLLRASRQPHPIGDHHERTPETA